MICVEVDQNGFVKHLNVSDELCDQFVLLNNDEYQNYLMMNDLLGIPDQQELVQVFELVFTSIMGVFIVSFFIARIAKLLAKL